MFKLLLKSTKTVSSQLTLWILVSILVVSGISASLFALIMYKNISRNINTEATELIEYFSGVIELPLWNFEEDSISLIVKTLSKNEDVESISVSDEKGNILETIDKNQNPNSLNKTKNIYHSGELIGKIKISFSQNRYIELLRQVMLFSVLILFTSLIPASLFINYLIRIFLKKPFMQLETIAAAYSSGNFNLKNNIVPISEFISFFNVLEKMGKKITLQIEELKYTTLFLETLKNTAPDAILILSENGIITETNETVTKLFGYTPDNLIGHFIDYIGCYDNDKKDMQYNINEVIERNENYFQWTVKDNKDTAVPVVVRLKKMLINNNIYIISFITDTRELKRAESEKKLSEEKYKRLIENLSDEYFFYSYNSKMELTYISPSINNILGYSADEFRKNSNNYLSSSILNKEAEKHRELLLGKKEKRASFDLEARDINSDIHILEISEVAVPDTNGIITSLEGIAHDVTEKRRIQENIRKTQKQEAIGTLAGGIAHDFNNILGAIIGYTELAQEETNQFSPTGEYLAEIHNASKRASQLVRQILFFSRQTNNVKTYLNLDNIINEVINLLKTSIPVNIDLKYYLVNNPGTVFGDAIQIHQVLINLVTNAYQSMKNNSGLIEITLDKVMLNKSKISQEKLLHCEDCYALISVRDTGQGIDNKIIDRIFEPYYTTKEHGEGTGLGLAVVNGIIKNHQGQIKIESESGKGTVFQVYLPAVSEHSIDNENALNNLITEENENILLVNNIIDIPAVTDKMLASLGYNITKTESPNEAVAIIKNSPDNFDLLISDYSMPEMTGLELSKMIYKLNSRIPVIICSESSFRIDEKEIEGTGIKLFIEKPVTIDDLSKAVKYSLNKMNYS